MSDRQKDTVLWVAVIVASVAFCFAMYVLGEAIGRAVT